MLKVELRQCSWGMGSQAMRQPRLCIASDKSASSHIAHAKDTVKHTDLLKEGGAPKKYGGLDVFQRVLSAASGINAVPESGSEVLRITVIANQREKRVVLKHR